MYIVELTEPLNWRHVSRCQEAARRKAFSQAMAAYVQWLARQYEAVRSCLHSERDRLAAEAVQDLGEGAHKRTPRIIADLGLALKYFLAFAVEVGALPPEHAEELWQRLWTALLEGGKKQREYVEQADYAARFIDLVRAALATGQAHVRGIDGSRPSHSAALGWREAAPQGTPIGWTDGQDLFLEPRAAYTIATTLARQQGDLFSLSRCSLAKRLHQAKLLAAVDADGKHFTIQKMCEGVRRRVWHLRLADVLEVDTN